MFEKCKEGLHPLVEIHREDLGYDACDRVIRWCPICGSIVIDREFDGRLQPGYFQKLTQPKIVQKYGLND